MDTPKVYRKYNPFSKTLFGKEFGIDRIGYFGSFVRGDYTAESDLDVLVSFKEA